ncbi:hypothetical protein B0T26DRAFT_679304 [Lasiosphaeria miniovina]|uniref:Uncharacterized protein n=1 Tax=Lasiosphaeria miniovina TaxID=1954250 RepID=A0AA40A653_9PEZI|nr:uncharacterized protein B0T26DRAFT_679304 [Lasiosphaeria miniovina]KAK0709962.1 hypothetical protein B0T26DRAFT_679304 [Lasiosphaeria miniovina]
MAGAASERRSGNVSAKPTGQGARVGSTDSGGPGGRTRRRRHGGWPTVDRVPTCAANPQIQPGHPVTFINCNIQDTGPLSNKMADKPTKPTSAGGSGNPLHGVTGKEKTPAKPGSLTSSSSSLAGSSLAGSGSTASAGIPGAIPANQLNPSDSEIFNEAKAQRKAQESKDFWDMSKYDYMNVDIRLFADRNAATGPKEQRRWEAPLCHFTLPALEAHGQLRMLKDPVDNGKPLPPKEKIPDEKDAVDCSAILYESKLKSFTQACDAHSLNDSSFKPRLIIWVVI